MKKAFTVLRGLYFPLNYTHIATYGLITFGENDFPRGKHIYLYNKRITGSDIFSLGKAAAECLLTCLPARKTACITFEMIEKAAKIKLNLCQMETNYKVSNN